MHFLGNDMKEAFGQTLVCKTHKAHKSEAQFLFIVLLKQQQPSEIQEPLQGQQLPF